MALTSAGQSVCSESRFGKVTFNWVFFLSSGNPSVQKGYRRLDHLLIWLVYKSGVNCLSLALFFLQKMTEQSKVWPQLIFHSSSALLPLPLPSTSCYAWDMLCLSGLPLKAFLLLQGTHPQALRPRSTITSSVQPPQLPLSQWCHLCVPAAH